MGYIIVEEYIVIDSKSTISRAVSWTKTYINEATNLINKRIEKFKNWCDTNGFEYDGSEDFMGCGALFDVHCDGDRKTYRKYFIRIVRKSNRQDEKAPYENDVR